MGNALSYTLLGPARVWVSVQAGIEPEADLQPSLNRFVDTNRFRPSADLSERLPAADLVLPRGHWFPPSRSRYYANGLLAEHQGRMAFGLSHYLFGDEFGLYLHMRNIFGEHPEKVLWAGGLVLKNDEIVEINRYSPVIQRWQELKARGAQDAALYNGGCWRQFRDKFDVPRLPRGPNLFLKNGHRLPFRVVSPRIVVDESNAGLALSKTKFSGHDPAMFKSLLSDILEQTDVDGKRETQPSCSSNSNLVGRRTQWIVFAKLLERVGLQSTNVSQRDLTIVRRTIQKYRWEDGYASIGIDRERVITAIRNVIKELQRMEVHCVDEIFLLD